MDRLALGTAFFATLLLAGCFGSTAPTPTPAAPAALPMLSCADPCEVAVDASEMRAFEPRVASDPSDPDHLVAVSEEWDAAGRRWIYAHTSTDAGSTWTSVRLPGGAAGGPGHPLAACTYAFDPIVAISSDGTVLAGGVAATEGVAGAYRDLFVARSTDGGATFPETVVITPAEGPGAQACTALSSGNPFSKFVDKPFLASREGVVFASWNVQAGLRFARSDDAGATWTALPELDHPDGSFSAALAPSTGGTLYTAFSPFGGSFVEGVYVARFDGTAWGRPVKVADESDAYADVAVGVGPAGERVWVSFPVGGGGGERQTPVLTWSDDGGATWNASIALDEPEAEGWIVPTLAVDARGVAYSGFYHHLGDGTNEYRVAAVQDGRPLAPLTVSATPIGYQSLGLQLGHYMGLAPLADGAYAVWVSGAVPSLVEGGSLPAGPQTADLRGARVATS